jgi:CHASE3 domain sensor protein
MPNENQATNLLNIESLINNFNARLETLQKEAKEHKEMLASILDNDAEFQEASKEAAKLAKLKTIAKQKVIKQPETAKLQDKINDYLSQIKEVRVGLSDYLSQYVSLSGSSQIEGPDGVLRQIVYSAKLVKAK